MKVNPAANEQAYGDLLREIKSRVMSAHLGAARAVNRALMNLYWDLGKLIVERQEALGWGKAVVEKLSADLRLAFPVQSGFSPQNLWLMRQMYAEYRHEPILQQLVGEIPWGQNVLILHLVGCADARRRIDRERWASRCSAHPTFYFRSRSSC